MIEERSKRSQEESKDATQLFPSPPKRFLLLLLLLLLLLPFLLKDNPCYNVGWVRDEQSQFFVSFFSPVNSIQISSLGVFKMSKRRREMNVTPKKLSKARPERERWRRTTTHPTKTKAREAKLTQKTSNRAREREQTRERWRPEWVSSSSSRRFVFHLSHFLSPIDDEKNNFLFKSNRSRVEEMPSPSPSSSSEKFKTALVRVSDAYCMRTCVARALLCCC